MARPSKYPVESRERAGRMVTEHAHEYASQWAAIRSIAKKLDCTIQVVRRWVSQAERDTSQRPGLTTSERERLKVLEQENRELKRANDSLRKASALFAQAELDRRMAACVDARRDSYGIESICAHLPIARRPTGGTRPSRPTRRAAPRAPCP